MFEGKGYRALYGGMALLLCGLFLAACEGEKSPQPVIVFETEPVSEALLSINGMPKGTTPVTVDNLKPGGVVLTFSKEGYKDKAEYYVVPDTDGEVRYLVRLEPRVGHANLSSLPEGATVFLNKVDRIGTAPLKNKPLPIGEHTLDFHLENHKDHEYPLLVEEDYQYDVVVKMVPEEASLTVLSSPSGADIWLNDIVQGKLTPAKFTLLPGEYVVTTHVKGSIQTEQVVLLAPNDDLTLELKMQRGNAPRGMLLIPAGEFRFGDKASPDERPQHVVKVDAFYIDKYEVTNAEYKAAFPSYTYDKGLDKHPVSGISFKKAQAYAAAVGKRLPTEVEWEKAARGTDGREYPWGTTWQDKCANADPQSPDSKVMPVGSLRRGASPYGVSDMAGNVYEWTSDWYQAYAGNTEVTAEYGQIFHVLRGGSYKSSRFEARCAKRHYDRIEAEREDYGIRCVLDVEK